MSILIKGMEMPEDCRECPLEMYYINSGETRCRAENKILVENFKTIPFDGRPDWCPLVEVPAPHGRLIDADELANKTFYSKTGAPYITYRRFVNAPTVIEALPPAQPEPERTMEEFMYGQDMGNPEDGSL